ncbi:lysine-specific demethylase 2A-like protein [Corchorus olitorius]|uniref:Lysine-specific demethylase 2A-like protein n=1 Tax=Corchorus olitorius TaxID=93759 RepID=A0A1R3L1I9_9ROSI|nr:lysine-specific demethylase 2A-like protein [Corchorus olitorius]
MTRRMQFLIEVPKLGTTPSADFFVPGMAKSGYLLLLRKFSIKSKSRLDTESRTERRKRSPTYLLVSLLQPLRQQKPLLRMPLSHLNCNCEYVSAQFLLFGKRLSCSVISQ